MFCEAHISESKLSWHAVQAWNAGALNPAGTKSSFANNTNGFGAKGLNEPIIMTQPANFGPLHGAPVITPQYLGEAFAPTLSMLTGFPKGRTLTLCETRILS